MCHIDLLIDWCVFTLRQHKIGQSVPMTLQWVLAWCMPGSYFNYIVAWRGWKDYLDEKRKWSQLAKLWHFHIHGSLVTLVLCGLSIHLLGLLIENVSRDYHSMLNGSDTGLSTTSYWKSLALRVSSDHKMIIFKLYNSFYFNIYYNILHLSVLQS